MIPRSVLNASLILIAVLLSRLVAWAHLRAELSEAEAWRLFGLGGLAAFLYSILPPHTKELLKARAVAKLTSKRVTWILAFPVVVALVMSVALSSEYIAWDGPSTLNITYNGTPLAMRGRPLANSNEFHKVSMAFGRARISFSSYEHPEYRRWPLHPRRVRMPYYVLLAHDPRFYQIQIDFSLSFFQHLEALQLDRAAKELVRLKDDNDTA